MRRDAPGLALAVIERRARLARNVLIEAAAEGDVQYLKSAADREQRNATRERPVRQIDLECVSGSGDFGGGRMPRLAEARGIHVAPASQEHSLDVLQNLAPRGRLQLRRQGDRDATGVLDGVEIRRVDVRAFRIFLDGDRCRDGDQRRIHRSQRSTLAPLAEVRPASMIGPTMSLDSASSQTKAPVHIPTSTPQVIGTRWAVAAGHWLASEAGARVLAAGGNAIDAGVAAGMTLGVVHCDMVSVAGVAPILVHIARTGETWQVSGVGPYPRATSAAYFRERHGGQIPPGLPRTVVPAAPHAWCTALERWGTMSFADVALAATEHAERGFAISQFTAYQMGANADKYRRWPSSASLYLRDNRALRVGEVLVQRELGETLRRMARAEALAGGSREAGIRAARDEFYRGETAKRIAEFHRAEGGPLAASDLAEFSVEVGPALRTTFGSYEVAACGFWCQGPSLLQMLNLLDGVNLKALGHNSAAYLHRIIETIKLAFADRDAYYGDPHFVKVPAEGLLSKAYAAVRRQLVKDRAWPQMPPAGDPDRLDSVRRPEAALPLAGGSQPMPGDSTDALDTSYVAVVDEAGNGFSATPSDPNVDSPVVTGVGCVVSPRGSQ